jgi:8-oxo-dGTP pyrophosphatase MutT (NUDIX family)
VSSAPSSEDARRPSPVAARDAATVLLVRDAPAGVEVLLLERHRGSRMAPGAHAFPGGRVEPTDAPADAERFCRGLSRDAAAAALRDVAPAERAIGFWVAALREAFEETGLLLACDAAGTPLSPDGPPAERPAAHRGRCRTDPAAFPAMLLDEDWALATDRMAYWAHWITPEERPVRYDTRFFVAAAFAGAAPVPDNQEVVGCRWLTAAGALAQHAAGAITVPMVTQRILGSIADYVTVGAILAAAPAREIRAVRPRILQREGKERILLPDDPEWY